MKKHICYLVSAILALGTHAMGQTITTFAGTGAYGNTGDFGSADAATLSNPKSVIVDVSGNVYIISGHTVRMVDNTGTITTVAGSASSFGYWGDGGDATLAGLYSPTGLAMDNVGNLYIADQENHRIRKVNTSGIISTVAGNGFAGFFGDGTPATTARLNFPYGVAVDASGNLYISDRSNERIRKVNTSGIISSIAGNGFPGFSGDGGPATLAQFQEPSGIALDASGNIYVADHDNARIRKISTSGTISTVAGTSSTGYSGDGVPAVTAALSLIYGVTVDASGSIFIPDYANFRVRKITSGTISTIAGTGTAGASGDGTPATAAQIDLTYAVAKDASGNIYIADGGNNKIRKICPGTLPVVSAITGPSVVCEGATITLSSTPTGGVWSSSTPGVATITTGRVVAGVSGGTTTITYRVTNPCGSVYSTAMITVNPLPTAGSILGTTGICLPGSTSLTSTVPGGTWTSSAAAIATVGSSSGIVTAHAAGTARISYSLTNSCGATVVTETVTVSSGLPTVLPVIGSTSICLSSSVTMSDATPGGSWSSAAAGVAPVTAGGIVAGISTGTATISYTLSNACGSAAATKIVTVNPLPSPGTISGSSLICIPATVTLTNASSAGVWSSSNTAIAAVATIGASTGVVSGVSAGTAIITFTATLGSCTDYTTMPISVSTLPTVAAVSGPSVLCQGSTVTLSDLTSGGTWSSSAAVVADGAGAVTGVLAGTAAVSYTITNACGSASAIKTVTVNPMFLSSSNIITTIAGNGTMGYTGDGGPATNAQIYYIGSITVDTAHNVYIGDSTGVIRKITPSGIITTHVSGHYAGYLTADRLGNIYFTDDVMGYIYKVDPSGLISIFAPCILNPSGLKCDYANNLYVASFSSNVIVKYDPSGASTVYAGTGSTGVAGDGGPAIAADLGHWLFDLAPDLRGNLYLTTSYPGGSFYERVRKIDASGIITTVVGSGVGGFSGDGGPAAAADIYTAIGLATDIPGNLFIADYTNGRIRRVDAATGIINTIAGTGLLTYNGDGIPATTANIDESAVCVDHQGNIYIADSYNKRVRKIPTYAGAITGSGTVCAGSTITLSDSYYPAYSSWRSSNTAIATVSASGVVTGVTAGTATITYRVTNSCSTTFSTKAVTVIALPVAGTITGGTSVCETKAITLSHSGAAGAWSSGSTGTATVSGSGIVTGIAAGSVVISYTVSNACGTAVTTKPITVNPTPSPGSISGATEVCIGAVVNMTNPVSTGIWSSSDVSRATISAAGDVTGLSAGIDTIIYSVTSGLCDARTTHLITVTDCTPEKAANDRLAAENMSITPNPSTGTFLFKLSSSTAEVVRIEITNVAGKKVKEVLTTTNSALEVTLNEAAGFYFLTAYTDSGSYTAKIILAK
jgi:sugar lactone lactonase YvrE/uncharacterized protein YjdB